MKEAHYQNNIETKRQKWYCDRCTGAVVLKPVVMLRTDAFVGKRKMKDKWSNEHYEVVCQNGNVPTYDIKDKNGKVKITHQNCLFLFSHEGIKEAADAITLEPKVQSAQTTEMSGETPLDNISLETGETQDDMLTEMPKEVSSQGLAQSLITVGPLVWLTEGFNSLLRVVISSQVLQFIS